MTGTGPWRPTARPRLPTTGGARGAGRRRSRRARAGPSPPELRRTDDSSGGRQGKRDMETKRQRPTKPSWATSNRGRGRGLIVKEHTWPPPPPNPANLGSTHPKYHGVPHHDSSFLFQYPFLVRLFSKYFPQKRLSSPHSPAFIINRKNSAWDIFFCITYLIIF